MGPQQQQVELAECGGGGGGASLPCEGLAATPVPAGKAVVRPGAEEGELPDLPPEVLLQMPRKNPGATSWPLLCARNSVVGSVAAVRSRCLR